jgi:hypothetical protein
LKDHLAIKSNCSQKGIAGMPINKNFFASACKEEVMNARKAVSLCFVSLLIGIGGCGSGASSMGPPTGPPGISISPVSAIAGSSDLVLIVTGSNFVDDTHNKSVVVWSANGTDTFLATTFVSSTQLTGVIPAALLANPVTARVLVETGDPLGSLPFSKSTSINFSVTAAPPPALSISSISPMSTIAGSPDLTLTVMGSSFANDPHNKSKVVWSANGIDTFLATTFVSSTQLTGVIPAALLANPVTARVLVETGDPLGSLPFSKSNSINFTVTSP